MSGLPPWGKQDTSPSFSPSPGGQGFPPFPPTGKRPGEYEFSARGPVRYLPVALGGEVVGYLWASPSQLAASFVRRSEADRQKSLRASILWSKRLETAWEKGLRPLEALRHWKGKPEDPEGGGISADAQEQEAESLNDLRQLAWPGSEPLQEPVAMEGTWPDGTPWDRSKGWGPLSPFTLEKSGYSFLTESAVRYLPVTIAGEVLGFLWASETEDAAYYERRVAAGADGFRAGGLWISRLEQCKQEGLTPLEALRRWVGEPEDPVGGGIAADTQEQEAESLEALKEITRQ